MGWKPHDVVAIILAMCVLVFVGSGTALRILVLRDMTINVTDETLQAWENIINVIIGSLASYIAMRQTKAPTVEEKQP